MLIIGRHGKYTLAGSIILVIFVLLSQRTSPEAFGPYIPMSIALSLLVTIYIVPWIRTSIQQRNAITLRDYIRATRGENSRGSTRAAVYPFSLRSFGGASRGNLNQDLELGPHPLDFYHMGPGSREHPSNVDLQSELLEDDESSTVSAGSREPFL
jgi:hypothetical protein